MYPVSALRVEWAKGRARQLRWCEEVLLLQEEMRRIRVTLEAKAVWWEERSLSRPDMDGAGIEGVRAYALEQAAVQRSLLSHFNRLWDQPTRPKKGKGTSTAERETTRIDPAVEALAADMDDSDEEED